MTSPMSEQTGQHAGHPVFYEIRVNKVTFRETHNERTGLQIKQDAIAAGVKIKTTYVLDEERPDGDIRISDDQVVAIHSGLKFVAHPGGSDS
jgi:hypothetical protein